MFNKDLTYSQCENHKHDNVVIGREIKHLQTQGQRFFSDGGLLKGIYNENEMDGYVYM